jgi:hypothetical protein
LLRCAAASACRCTAARSSPWIRNFRSRVSPRALSEFGRIDILINNAAIRPHKPFTESTDADWELIRSVVLDGPLHLTRALIEPMVENRYGRILFFCGDGSISASGSGRTHLSAAKMGLCSLRPIGRAARFGGRSLADPKRAGGCSEVAVLKSWLMIVANSSSKLWVQKILRQHRLAVISQIEGSIYVSLSVRP